MYRRSIAALCLALVLAACGGAPATAPSAASATDAPAAAAATTAPAPTDAPQPTVAPEPTAIPTAEPAEPGTSRSAPLKLGTELSFKEWAITITDVVRGKDAADALAKANQFNDPAPEGYEYLLTGVKVTNISTEQKPKDPAFGVDIRLTGDRNILYGRSAGVSPKPLEGELLPKGSAEGQLVFLAPSDEKNLMFRVGDLVTIDDTEYRYVAVDEGAAIAPPSNLPVASESGATRGAPAKLNEAVATDKYEVTVLEVVQGEDAAKKIAEANQFNDPAPEGQAYIAVRVKVRAGGSSPDSVVNIDSNWFKVSGEKSVVYERPTVVAPEPSLDISLYPGGEAEGWVVVSAPPDEKGLVLNIAPLFSFSDDDARYVALS